MSILEIVNRFCFQWFFIRLTRIEYREITDFKLHEISILEDGSFGIGGKVNADHRIRYYAIQYFIRPLTGWKGSFKFIGKNSPKFFRITKKYRYEI